MNEIFDFKINSIYLVDVTFINNPHSFYVRSVKHRDIMHEIEKPNGSVSALEVQLGHTVIYKSNLLGKCVRGEICFIINEKYDIFAIDYGCLDRSIPIQQIYSLGSTVEPKKRCPALALHCQLHFCEPTGEEFNEEAIDYMKSLIGKSSSFITVKSKINNKYVVDLCARENACDIAKMLSMVHLTTMTKYGNTLNRFYNSSAPQRSKISTLNLTQTLNYKHRDFKVGDTLHVRVQSGTSLSGFYVADINEYKKFITGQPSFSMYCKDHPIQDEDIVPGRPCAVKTDFQLNKYERAIIKEVIKPESKATLQLVDWGKDVKAPFKWIKSVVSAIYFTQPILAIYCSTDENQVWHTGLPNFLFPGFELVIKIIEVGNKFDHPHRVNIYPLQMFKPSKLLCKNVPESDEDGK